MSALRKYPQIVRKGLRYIRYKKYASGLYLKQMRNLLELLGKQDADFLVPQRTEK